ncbi:hypothetical protein [Nostoc sp.]|uniref:hypothetical protein n=1 Tax=Nostoc sp. TaxID=1180 RepID=UPI002FF68949
MLTRSFAQSQVKNNQYQLKIIKTSYTVKVLCQYLMFLILLIYVYTAKVRGSAFNPRNFLFASVLYQRGRDRFVAQSGSSLRFYEG